MSRTPYTNASIDDYGIGSLIVVHLAEENSEDQFDFIDISDAHTVGLAIDNIGLVAVFGDGGAVKVAIQELIVNWHVKLTHFGG